VPFTVVQLTDPHLGAPWSDDPGSALAASVAAVGDTLGRAPDAVIITGDIASTPTDEEYAEARAHLDRLGAPLYALPGNHDDRDALRRHFDVPGAGPVSYTVGLGSSPHSRPPVRLVALDSTHPGSDGGQLDAPRLEWLEGALGEDESTPTLLAMHHLPLVTGIPALDAIGIPADEREALASIVSRHPQVQVVACGHVHRALIGTLGPAAVVAIPSTDVQLALDFESGELRFVREPPCFAVHVAIDGRLVSHIQPVRPRTGG
jgi:3',5'-cyclic AMP phosphodiesterase CpdA